MGRSSVLPTLGAGGNLVAGAAARVAAGGAMMPVTVVKVRMESSLYAYEGMMGAVGEIWRGEGVRGFFAGYGATAVRDAPYAGLYVVFYEWGKVGLGGVMGGEGRLGRGGSVGVNFLSGVGAAAAATVVTNPFDVVKTRLQLMPERYTGMVSGVGKMVGEGGWGCLMDGVWLRMGRKAASSALAWTLYEELVRRGERGLGW